MKIVVVDDFPGFTAELSEWLSGKFRNVEFLPYEDSREALKFILSNEVSILVTDHDMPYMNGKELIEKAKENKPELKTIIFSGGEDINFEGSMFISKSNMNALLNCLNGFIS